MGSYGIGVERILAAAVESGHDDDGIIWPGSIAPFDCLICVVSAKDGAVVQEAEKAPTWYRGSCRKDHGDGSRGPAG